MTDLSIPDRFDMSDKRLKPYVLASDNSQYALREELNAVAGLERDNLTVRNASQFTKQELARLIVELGGPRRDDDD